MFLGWKQSTENQGSRVIRRLAGGILGKSKERIEAKRAGRGMMEVPVLGDGHGADSSSSLCSHDAKIYWALEGSSAKPGSSYSSSSSCID